MFKVLGLFLVLFMGSSTAQHWLYGLGPRDAYPLVYSPPMVPPPLFPRVSIPLPYQIYPGYANQRFEKPCFITDCPPPTRPTQPPNNGQQTTTFTNPWLRRMDILG